MSTYAAPGKLFIAGEYSVVTPGSSAILTSVRQGITATATTRSNASGARVRVFSNHFGQRPLEWDGTDVETAGARAVAPEPVARALTVIAEFLEGEGVQLPRLDIHVSSELVSASGVKFGFGSSGAVVVAVIGAVAREAGISLCDRELFMLSSLAVIAGDRRASCADVAVSVLGGWVFYRSFDRERAQAVRARDGVRAAMEHGFDSLEMARLVAPSGCSVVVGHSGIAASTRELVARFDRAVETGRYDGAAFNHASDRVVSQLRAACEQDDAQLASAAIRHARELLADLDHGAGHDGATLGIVTAPLEALILSAGAAGAEAKSSGAGGGDCAIAFATSAAMRADVEAAWTNAGYETVPIEVMNDTGRADERIS